MGSAVVKPLTRRRGKVKTNELVETSADWNCEENVNDNCQPSVDCLDDSVVSNAKNLSESINGTPDGTSNETSPDGMSPSLLKELTVTTPENTFDKTGRQNQSKPSTPAKDSKGLSILERCFLSSVCATMYKDSVFSPRTPETLNTIICHRQDKQSQTNFAVSSERSSIRQSCRSPRTDVSMNTSGNLAKETDSESPEENNSLANLCVHTNGLSHDQIGNIRNQLYTEGLNPAEREGGVAFFIPVTEDGMQPQSDWTVVAERLTKKKKASLNFEERMILANINRQVQLSKRKEFAVRDIRNVKGAVSTTDETEKIRQEDDEDIDASVMKKTFTDIEFDVSIPKKTTVDTEVDTSDQKKRSMDGDHDIAPTGEEGC